MSYWCDRKLIVTASRDGEAIEFPLDTPYARVGSHEKSDVLLPDLPRQALYLHATASGVYSYPVTKSSRGEFFQGWMEEDVPVPCGDWHIRVRFHDAAPMFEGTSDLTAELAAGEKTPLLAIKRNEKTVAKHHIRKRLVRIGRDHPSDLRLHTGYVSSAHCMAYWDERYLWIVDLCSTNGTRKDGVRFHAARLRRGRSITIGPFRLVFDRVEARRPVDEEGHASSINEADKPHSPARSKSYGDEKVSHPSSQVVASDQREWQLARLEDRLCQWEERVLKTERDLARQLALLEKREASVAAMNVELDSRAESLQEALQALEDQTSQLKQLEVALDQRAQALDERQEEVDEFFRSLEQQRSALRESQIAQDAARHDLEELEQLRNALEHERQALRHREEELEQWQERLSEQQCELDALRQELDSRAADASAAFREAQEELTARESTVAEQQRILDEQQRLLETKESELKALQDALQQQQAELAERTSALHEAQEELAEHESAIARRQRDLAEQEQRLESKEREVDSLRSELEDLREAAAQVAAEHHAALGAQAELDAQRAELEQRRLELDEQTAMLKRQQEELDELRQQVDQERTTIEQSRQKLQEERARLEALAIEQSEQLLELQQREELRNSAGGTAQRDASPTAGDAGAEAEDDRSHEELPDPQRMIAEDSAYDELTARLVEFGRKKKRRWLW